jgi:TolB-like protein
MNYRFDDCLLDSQRRELHRCGRVVPIEPQIFDLLQYLLGNRGRVVSRDELIAELWKGRIVSESTLSSRISTVRTAIGDDGKQQRLVKTFSRRGVRFVAEVHEIRDGDAGRPAPIVIVPDKPSIAVLSFASFGGDRTTTPFANGLVEEIITDLSRGSDFFVVTANSSVCVPSGLDEQREYRRRLGVSYFLEGSVRTARTRVRVCVRLVDTDTGAYRWVERYDRKLKNVISVQDELASAIVTAITTHVARLEVTRAALKPPETWRAREYYARATEAWAVFHSRFRVGDLKDTQQVLGQCLSIEPAHSRAHALLAETHLVAYQFPFDDYYLNPAALDKAEGASSRALQCDPQSPFAHAVAGRVLGFMGDYGGSIAEFERAENLNPSSADWRLVAALIMMGQHTRAVEVGQRYIRNDPFHSPLASMWLGVANFMLRRYSHALPCLRAAVLRAPNLRAARVHLAANFAQLNQVDAARRQVDAALCIEPMFTLAYQKRLAAVCRYDSDIAHHLDALRKAGLPD